MGGATEPSYDCYLTFFRFREDFDVRTNREKMCEARPVSFDAKKGFALHILLVEERLFACKKLGRVKRAA